MSYQFKLEPFYDIDNPSTLNLDLLEDIPKVVDLKNVMTSVKNQGPRGMCTFFSALAVVESAVKKKMNVDVNLSEEYFNHIAKKAGIYPKMEGSVVDSNLKLAISDKKGFLLERDWPYQPTWFAEKELCVDYTSEDSSAPALCFSHNAPPENILAKKINADGFSLVDFSADTTNDIIKILASRRLPLDLTMPVNNKGWPDNGNIKYTEEMRAECIADSSVCGFHSVTITGYDLDKKVFFFKNSWGVKWGNEGYGTIPFDVVDRHVLQNSSLVELKNKITLPRDFNRDYFKIKNFKVNISKADDQSIQVESRGTMENIGFNTVKIDSVLVKSDKLSDENTEEVGLINTSARIYDEEVIFQEAEIQHLVWDEKDPVILNLSLENLKPKEKNLFIKTSLSRFTDEMGYKVLKVIYRSLNNSSNSQNGTGNNRPNGI